MGYAIGSGKGSGQPKGGHVKPGWYAARFVKCEPVEGNYGPQFQWTVEIFNPDGANAITSVWTNKTLNEKGRLYAFAQTMGIDTLADTDDMLGHVFNAKTEDRERDGVLYTNIKKQGAYLIDTWEEEDPFELTVEETLVAWAEASEDEEAFGQDQSDDIPF